MSTEFVDWAGWLSQALLVVFVVLVAWMYRVDYVEAMGFAPGQPPPKPAFLPPGQGSKAKCDWCRLPPGTSGNCKNCGAPQ